MGQYDWKCWLLDNDETEEDATIVISGQGDIKAGAQALAEQLVEENFGKWDYPSEVTLGLRGPQGNVYEVVVYVETVPSFFSYVRD